MAEFNRTEQKEPLPPSYVESSPRQFDGDRSAAILGEGLTKAFSDFVKATDENIQQNIADDIARGYDELNDAVVGSAMRDPSQNLPGEPTNILPSQAQENVPAGVRQAQARGEAIQAANRQGVISEPHYRVLMNSLLRNTYAKYPGYRHQVDQAFRTVTGSRGNEHLEHLWKNMGKEDPAIKAYNDLVEEGRRGGSLPPDFFARKRQGRPYEHDELSEYVAKKNREKAEVELNNAKMTGEAKKNTLTKETAEELFSTEAHRTVRNILDTTVLQSGQTWAGLVAKVSEWERLRQNNKSINPKEQEQVLGMLNEFERLAASAIELQYQSNRAPAGSAEVRFSTYVKGPARDQTFDAAMYPVRLLKQAVTTGDTALMKQASVFLESTKNMDARELIERFPRLRVSQALSDMVGADTAALIMRADEGHIPSMVRELLNFKFASAGIADPNGDPQKLPSIREDMAEAARTKGAEKFGDAAVKRWKGYATQILAGNFPAAEAAKFANYFFGPKNLAVMSELPDDASRRAYFSQMTEPTTTEAMKRLRDAGDLRSWNMYKSWTLQAFQYISQRQLQSLKNFNIDQGRAQYQYDPKVHQFKFVGSLTENQGDPMSGMNASAVMTQVTNELDKLNALVRNVVPLMIAEGVDPADQFSRLFAAGGFGEGQTVADSLAQGAAQGAGPPKPGVTSIWEDAAPFLPQFRGPGAEQGVGQPGPSNRPLPKSGSIQLGPYGVASLHGATQEDVYMVQRALNGALGMFAPTITREKGSPVAAKGPYIQLKSGARIHLPPVAQSTLEKFAPKLQEFLPGAKLIQKVATNDDVADNVAQQARVNIPQRSLTAYAGLSGTLDEKELDEPAEPAGPLTQYEPSDPALKIVYRADEEFQYGKSATKNAKPFTHLVVHHAVGTAEDLVKYGQRVDKARGGAFGYHFYIAEDGTILQGAPLNKRTNHISHPNSAVRTARYEANNSNSLGITLVNAHDGATPEQLEAAERLALDLSKRYKIPLQNIIGHGEIQSNRMSIEGRELLDRLKANKPIKDKEFAKLSSVDKMMILAEALGEA